MAGMRTRSGRTFSGPSRTTLARVDAIALELHHECTLLLGLYRTKESFSPELTVGNGRPMLSMPPPSSQLSTRDKLWRLYSALLQCRGLLVRAVTQEEEEFGGGEGGEYESQRKTVRDRLGHLLDSMRRLLEEVEGAPAITANTESIEQIDGPTSGGAFELKLWIYRIFSEVEHWSRMTTATLRSIPLVMSTAGGRRAGKRMRRGKPK
ncbi:ciliary neurotrophic factor isoform X1 [Osmerus eperlanus]|uniref:ciliary neurotrophic factor n=1 Tax=Osmerus mordax TaxID=8014 RepID=UPI002E106250